MQCSLDFAQYVRGRGCVRQGASSLARKNPAGGRSEDAATRTRQGHAGRTLHCGGSRMTTVRTAAIVLRHLYLVSASPARMLPLFAWVAIDMVLWGFITKYLNAVSAAG